MKSCNYFKNMVKESIRQEFILKNIDETRNYELKFGLKRWIKNLSNNCSN